MRYSIFLIAILLASCAKQSFRGNDPGANLRPYVDSFAEAWGGDMPEIVYVFGPIDDAAGKCISGDGGLVVQVNDKDWDRYCEAQKKSLVWHELGHCVLGRSHTEPDAISHMAPNLYQCAFYEENEAELDAEMFM